jgi:YcxB-like protein
LLAPLNVYQLYANSVDGEPQLTDQKMLEFSLSRVAFTGPDWKNEMTWKRFKAFSEDAEYFFLDLRHGSLAAIIPKSAFTPEQQQTFRQYAGNRSA